MNNLTFTSIYDFRQGHTYHENVYKENKIKTDTKGKFLKLRSISITIKSINLIKPKIDKYLDVFFKYIDSIVLSESESDLCDFESFKIKLFNKVFKRSWVKRYIEQFFGFIKKMNSILVLKKIKYNIFSSMKRFELYSSRLLLVIKKISKKKFVLKRNIFNKKKHIEVNNDSKLIFKGYFTSEKLKRNLLGLNHNFKYGALNNLIKNNIDYSLVTLVSIIYFSIWSFFIF